jgi:hypothetical protein
MKVTILVVYELVGKTYATYLLKLYCLTESSWSCKTKKTIPKKYSTVFS